MSGSAAMIGFYEADDASAIASVGADQDITSKADVHYVFERIKGEFHKIILDAETVGYKELSLFSV